MNAPLLQVHQLTKKYHTGGGLLSRANAQHAIPAVDGISFQLDERQTLGLVGESGCGKTTTGKAILKLVSPSGGNIVYRGTDIGALPEKQFRPYRKQIQMIFQDLDAALNPKVKIRDILAEAFSVHHPGVEAATVQSRVRELLDRVNLKKSKLDSYPTELSGGEKRRVGIARVLAVEPELIVADEPTSALDVSIQAQVINLLRDLQKDLGLSCLFISHDLPLVEIMSERIAVMYLGRIVEMGPANVIASAARHPYTRILWSSLSEGASGERQAASQSPSSWGVFDFERPSGGCRFAPRCPRYEQNGRPACCTDPHNEPQLKEQLAGHHVACHFPD